MPHTDDIEGAALDAVAKEVGRTLPQLLGPEFSPKSHVAITSSFTVMKLSSDQVEGDPSNSLSDLVVDTGRWHHQVEVDEKPVAYARSVFTGREWIVEEVTVSVTARDIAATIAWVDANIPEDDLARLLEAPAYDLRGFWLIGTGRVVVAQASPRLVDLQRERLVTERDVLARLRATKPIVGVALG